MIAMQATEMKAIAERMQSDPTFYEQTLNELKVKNPSLADFIKKSPDRFYMYAANGRLGNLALKPTASGQSDPKLQRVIALDRNT